MKKISLAYYKPLVYILIFLFQFPLYGCMITDEQEQCHECFRETICNGKTSSFLLEAIDIGLVNGTDSWLMEKFDAENIVQDLSMPPCIRNRIRGIVAFVFGRQSAPHEISGCDDSTDCNNPNCSKYLTVANNTLGNDGKIEPRKMKLLSMLGKAIFFGNNSHGNTLLQTDEDKDVLDLPPKAHVSCPTQKHYPIIERVNILLYTARNLFNCTSEKAATFTSPQLTPQNISHDAFMDKVMLMKMNVFSNLLAITDRLGMSKSTLEHKPKCQSFADKFYATKTMVVYDAAMHLFGCKACPESNANMDGNTTSGVFQNTTHGCRLQDLYLASEHYFGSVRMLKLVIQKSLDCRFSHGRCKFVSRSSINSVYFKLKYILGCPHCIEEEVCQNPGSLECLQKWLPALKTLFHAIQDAGSEASDCRFIVNKFAGGEVEKSVLSLMNFHKNLFTLSNLASSVNITLLNCTSPCEQGFGSQRTCDICNAIQLGKVISSLTTSVLNCEQRFQFNGESFCKPEDLLSLYRECLVNYNSTITYTQKGQEVVTLTFAIAALSGCGSVDTGNQYSNFESRCAYLNTVLDRGSTTMPKVVFPQHWLDTKAFQPSLKAKEAMEKIYPSVRCSQDCPPWQELCAMRYTCMPRYLNCQPIPQVPPKDMYPVIGHVDMTDLRSSVFYLSGFINETTIVTKPRMVNQHGDWIVHFSNGRSSNLSRTSGGLVVSSSAYFTFDSNNDNAYGIRILQYYNVTDMQLRGFLPNGFNLTEGAFVNTSLIYSSPKMAALLIRPIGRTEPLTLKKQLPSLMFLEDTRYDILARNPLHLQDFFEFRIKIEDHDVSSTLYPYIPKPELDLFYQYKMTFDNHRPVAQVISMHGSGTWKAKVRGEELSSGALDLRIGSELTLSNSEVYFLPNTHWHGVAWLHFNVCYCNLQHLEERAVPLNITIKVQSVNDQPIALTKALFLPVIAYNTTAVANEGFLISSLQKYVTDVDNPSVGIAVLSASYSRIGKWYYNLGNTSWQEFKQRKQLRHTERAGSLDILRLKPDDQLKLVLHDKAAVWSHLNAMKGSWLHFMFWDMTDGTSNGFEIVMKEDLRRSSSYGTELFGFMLKRGCNGIPGSLAKVDKCNVCGGDGRSCVGCDGRPYSGARYDSCGQCTGGSTGRARNSMRDCAGTCGKAEIDDCNICQRKTSGGSRKSFKDCMGVCFGRARLNKCGQCYGGTSSLNRSAGMDVCGVCNGDGTTCNGCDGISNSGKILDNCGLCLNPKDPFFNSNCTNISGFKPRNAHTTGGRRVEITGAGFVAYKIANCWFEGNRRNFSAAAANISNKASFTIKTPATDSGIYRLRCSFDNSTEIYEASSQVFKFYTAVSLYGVSPVRILKGKENNVTVNGTGFLQTDELHCAILPESRSLLIKANVLSDRESICSLPVIPRSMNLQITVVGSKEDGDMTSLKSLPPHAWKNVDVYAAAPRPVTATLSKNLKTILIKFDTKIHLIRKGCGYIFTSAVVAKLGRKASCYKRSLNQLAVRLGLSASLVPGDSLVFNSGAISQHKEKISDTTNSAIIVQTEASLNPLMVHITGPSQIGSCDPARLKAEASGNAGGRKLSFSWNVSYSYEVDMNLVTDNDTADLLAIRTYLSALPLHSHVIYIGSQNIKQSTSERYLGYEFSVVASNFLGQTSNIGRFVVQRTSTKAPTVKILGGLRRKVRSNKNLVLRGAVRHSSCQSSKELLIYRWEVSSPEVKLDKRSRSSPRLYVPRGSLLGGGSYVFTLTASLANDPFVFSSASVEVSVDSSDLVAKIRGGRYRVVGSDSSFSLDASPSYDPDRDSTATESFNWECYDQQTSPCLVPHVNDSSKMVRLVLAAAKKVTIERGTLSSNETYTFVFTYSKGTRSVSKEIRIGIMPGSPPVVKIRPQRHSKVNSDERVIVKGFVQSVTPGGVDVWWDCLDDGDFNYINLTEPGIAKSSIRRKIKRTGISWSVLIINKGVLVEGASYKLRLTAQNSQGGGYAENVIVVNGPPTLGSLTSHISQGVALQTLFNLQAIEGWTDDPLDLPLSFKFGYIKANGEDAFLGGVSQETEMTVVLPAGEAKNNFNLTLFVDATDTWRAKTRAYHNVVVTPLTVIDKNAVSHFADNIVDAFKANDLSSVIGQVTSTVNVLNEASSTDGRMAFNISTEIHQNIIKFKENATAGIINILKTVVDSETQNMILTLMSDVTKDGKFFDSLLRDNIADSLASIIKGQIKPDHLVPVAPTISSMQAPVLVPSEDVEEDFAKSPEEVEKIVETYDNIINATAHDNLTMSMKRKYTGLTPYLLQSMCSGSEFGDNASLAKSNLSTLQSYKYDMADGGKQNISVECDDCEQNGMINLGDDLVSKYNSWECTQEYTCNGVCVGSVQYPNDIFSDEQSQKNNTMVSSTLQVELFNPETNAAIHEQHLTSPITIMVPIDESKYNSSRQTECRYWDDFSSTWKNDSCTAEQELTTIGNETYVVCHCTRTGTFAAFEAPIVGKLEGSKDNTDVKSPSSANTTKNDPLITLFVFLGIFGLSSVLGVGFFGYEKHKASVQLTPRNS